jgi:Biotin carboxylase, N-terminal domain
MFKKMLLANLGEIACRVILTARKMGIKTVAILFTASSIVAAEETRTPLVVRVVRAEQISGGVERPTGDAWLRQLRPMPKEAYEVKDGLYRSYTSRITLRIPRIGDETFVDVREAVSLFRADGSKATTHIMFDADGTKTDAAVSQDAQSAVIVTRLRDDRPKDVESVLATLDGGEQKRALWTKQGGFSYARTETSLGPALQRVIRNRANTRRFPYDIAQLNETGTMTYGVTSFVVVGTDSLVELSQLFPCAKRSDVDCQTAALNAHKEFVGGVTEFSVYPPQGTPPAPTPK